MPPDIDPEVLQTVPHRAPILRVQRLLARDAERAHVLGREPTGDGALPWSLGAVEGIAQSAALLLAHGISPAPGEAPRRGMLVAIKRFSVVAEPAREAPVHYHVRLVRRLGNTALIAGHAETEGVRLAAGELTLWIAAGP